MWLLSKNKQATTLLKKSENIAAREHRTLLCVREKPGKGAGNNQENEFLVIFLFSSRVRLKVGLNSCAHLIIMSRQPCVNQAFDLYRIRSDFCSGNLATASQVSPHAFVLEVVPDNTTGPLGLASGGGGGDEDDGGGKYKAWYHFCVERGQAGNTIVFTLNNMNKHTKLYRAGMKPVYRSLPSHPVWSRYGHPMCSTAIRSCATCAKSCGGWMYTHIACAFIDITMRTDLLVLGQLERSLFGFVSAAYPPW
jgi:hypothetical protein